MFEDIALMIGILIMLSVPVMGFISTRHRAALEARLARLRPPHLLFADSLYDVSRVSVSSPHDRAARWQKAYVFVANKRIVGYSHKLGDDTPLFDFAPHQLEGFWRPKKYSSGDNVIELHVNADGKWQIVRLLLSKTRMLSLVRALKQLVDADMVRAYRQRRPYSYRGPAPAQLATQNLQGAWELDAPFKVYLMPSALVFLDDRDNVLRMIPLRDIQGLAALRRLDAPKGGLVRFTLLSTGQTLAIALDDYEAWGRAIAVAARRTLEQPLAQKQKKRQDDDMDDDLYDEGGEELVLPELSGFLVIDDWHDGEIIAWQPDALTRQAGDAFPRS